MPYPRPPFVPVTKLTRSFTSPTIERLATVDETCAGVCSVGLPSEAGATSIRDRAHFEALSKRDDVPGALGVREVKFLISGVDTDKPRVFFINVNKYQYHVCFALKALKIELTGSEFNLVTYFKDKRRFLAGTIIAHDKFERSDGSTGLYAMEFWPTDPVKVGFAALAFGLIRDAVPFFGNQLVYHPSGAGQEDLFEEEKEEFERRGVRSISTTQLFEGISYSPLNLGIGFGTIRVVDGSSPRPPTLTDVAIFKTLPNDLSHVAGVLSEEPQTPLSHVKLRAKQNDTPNAYLRHAAKDPRVDPHIGKIVRFEVTPDNINIRAATEQEMEDFYEKQRPPRPQIPARDLSRTEIVNLDDIGFCAFEYVGAKAANVAQLRKLLGPEIVPSGYAVPFYFYDRFMIENDLYKKVRKIIEDDQFESQEGRERGLKLIRKKIRNAKVPKEFRKALGEMHASFPVGVNPRCRSSTNNEDLPKFNGAGLYDSFTHRPDEGHIEKSIKQVWASLWTDRAFLERHFYRVDHFQTAMAVLVHKNFDCERANGVAVTKNAYFPDFPGFYVNVQVGETLVTNPEGNAVSEELLIMRDVNPANKTGYETVRIRRSNRVRRGKSVLTDDQLELLRKQMELIQKHFKQMYLKHNDDSFAMDLEFKIDRDGELVIKQARPWVE